MVILLFAMKVSTSVWICYSKKFLMRRNEIVNRHTWKLILNNFSCIEIWIRRSYSRKCGQICRNFMVFGLGISLFRNKRFVLNEMFQQYASNFSIFRLQSKTSHEVKNHKNTKYIKNFWSMFFAGTFHWAQTLYLWSVIHS